MGLAGTALGLQSERDHWRDRAWFFEDVSKRYYAGLAAITRHADYPAGEEWEQAYNEVVEFARAALSSTVPPSTSGD